MKPRVNIGPPPLPHFGRVWTPPKTSYSRFSLNWRIYMEKVIRPKMFYIKFPTNKLLTDFCMQLNLSELWRPPECEAEYKYLKGLETTFRLIFHFQLWSFVTHVVNKRTHQFLCPHSSHSVRYEQKHFFLSWTAQNCCAVDSNPLKIGGDVGHSVSSTW